VQRRAEACRRPGRVQPDTTRRSPRSSSGRPDVSRTRCHRLSSAGRGVGRRRPAGYRRQVLCEASARQFQATAPHSPQTGRSGRPDLPGSIPATCDLIHPSARTRNRSDGYIRKWPVTCGAPLRNRTVDLLLTMQFRAVPRPQAGPVSRPDASTGQHAQAARPLSRARPDTRSDTQDDHDRRAGPGSRGQGDPDRRERQRPRAGSTAAATPLSSNSPGHRRAGQTRRPASAARSPDRARRRRGREAREPAARGAVGMPWPSTRN
jgi:hypothetical protein